MSANRRFGRSGSAGLAMAPGRPIHSVAGMSNSITLRRSGMLLVGVAAINAIVFSPLGDDWFLAIVLFGPIATGIVVGVRHGDRRLAAATWAASGLCWLVGDWIVNRRTSPSTPSWRSSWPVSSRSAPASFGPLAESVPTRGRARRPVSDTERHLLRRRQPRPAS